MAECKECEGTGEAIEVKDDCLSCDGTGCICDRCGEPCTSEQDDAGMCPDCSGALG